MLDDVATRPPGVTQGAEGFPRRKFTTREVIAMIEAGVIAPDERFELIEGEIVPMSPQHHDHESIKSELVTILARLVPDHLRLGIETSVYLADDTFVNPDVTLFPKAIRTDAVAGTDLLLAVEIAATTMRYDKGKKAPLYAANAFREFWLIDARERVTWVHTRPENGEWGSVVKVPGTEPLTLAALPGLAFRVADVR
jgi:Uma2 family endonuclease